MLNSATLLGWKVDAMKSALPASMTSCTARGHSRLPDHSNCKKSQSQRQVVREGKTFDSRRIHQESYRHCEAEDQVGRTLSI